METDRDPYVPENIGLMIAGLRAFRDRGDPITDVDVYAWAKDVLMDRPTGIVLGVVLAVNAGV